MLDVGTMNAIQPMALDEVNDPPEVGKHVSGQVFQFRLDHIV